MGAGKRCGGDHSFHRLGRIGERDVVAYRSVEQYVLLEHDADLPSQPRRVHHGKIDAVDQDATALGDVETLHELRQRALAGPRGADDADNLAGRHVERDVMQHLGAVRTIAERRVVESDLATDGGSATRPEVMVGSGIVFRISPSRAIESRA